jgi:hypothetical protein
MRGGGSDPVWVPCVQNRIGRARLSYCTVESASPAVVVVTLTFHSFWLEPPSFVRTRVRTVSVMSGRISWISRPKPSYFQTVVSWFSSWNDVMTPKPASKTGTTTCPTASVCSFGKTPLGSYLVDDARWFPS